MDISFELNNVIEYIEDNLFGTIEYDKAAQLLGLSEFHFQRMFSFLAGIPIAEYIRNRKMAMAALELKKENTKVIDIAMKYGYDSHSSFTRAFQRYHGITPTLAKRADAEIKTCPKILFDIGVYSENNIKFRIEKTKPYKLFGKNEITVPVHSKKAKDIIIDYAKKVVSDGTHDSINIAAGFSKIKDGKIHLLKGIYFKEKDGSTSFMYGWEVPDGDVENKFTVIDVPAHSWIVFKFNGKHSEALPKIWEFFYTRWLPTAEYEIEDTIFIENEIFTDKDNFFAEVWIPVKA